MTIARSDAGYFFNQRHKQVSATAWLTPGLRPGFYLDLALDGSAAITTVSFDGSIALRKAAFNCASVTAISLRAGG